MIKVEAKEFIHGLSEYLKAVKKGERVVILEGGIPVADLLPYRADLSVPGWKRPIKRIRIKGESLSKTVSRMRDEERY